MAVTTTARSKAPKAAPAKAPVAKAPASKGPTPKPPAAPHTITVYRTLDGAIHHTRCNQRMTYHGSTAGGLELQFHCAACHERVMLPQQVVAHLPVTTGGAA